MSNLYNENSIESLDPRTFTRLKPFVYCGSTEYATQLLIEGFSNCVDEANLGNGNIIRVTVKEDNTVILEDEGQGFIVNSIRDDGKTILEAAFSVLNTSGKYREDGTYAGTSLGAFGIGSKLICFLSSNLEVITYRDNKYEKILFIDGLFENREVGALNRHSGTILKWTPDPQFFTSTDIEYNRIKDLFQTISCLCTNITIEFTYKDKEKQIFHSTNGLNDLVDIAVKNNELLKNRLSVNLADNKTALNLVLTYTSNYDSQIIPYVNTGLTESGPHITMFKSIITREFNKFFKSKGWLKENEENLSGNDLQEGLYLVFNLTAPSVKYDAQIKSRVTGINTQNLYSLFSDELIKWLENNSKEIKILAEKAILARTAREKARQAREAVREAKEKKKRKVINPDKLKDAETLGQDSILLVVEGNSAAASMAVARDINHYGILGLRGKPLNLLTNSQEKANKNEEIQLLISALGITPGNYNSSDLRYGKLAIASDADSDGLHIGLLVASAIYVLCPEFIKEGRLCWLRSPLYILKNGKTESYYYSDEELAAAGGSNLKGELSRAKGLGALSAEQAKNSMFNSQYQRLDILEYSPEAIEKLKKLMGESVSFRKQFIFNNIDFSEVKE